MTLVKITVITILVFPQSKSENQNELLFKVTIGGLLYYSTNFLNLICLKKVIKSYIKVLAKRNEPSVINSVRSEAEESSQENSDLEEKKKKLNKKQSKPVSSVPIYLVLGFLFA
jgi:hypothetical protein